MSVCLCVGICKCVQVPVVDMGEDFMELESQGVCVTLWVLGTKLESSFARILYTLFVVRCCMHFPYTSLDFPTSHHLLSR